MSVYVGVTEPAPRVCFATVTPRNVSYRTFAPIANFHPAAPTPPLALSPLPTASVEFAAVAVSSDGPLSTADVGALCGDGCGLNNANGGGGSARLPAVVLLADDTENGVGGGADDDCGD